MVSIIKEKYENEIDAKYLLALLNSKLYTLWLENQGKRKGEMLELYGAPLNEIPIKVIPLKYQQKFIQLINQILEIQENRLNSSINDLQQEIDFMTYEIFKLTKNEISIVEKKYSY